MSTVYTTEFMEEHEALHEQYHSMKKRNARAKELRRQGWKVICEKCDFSDLARDEVYILSGIRKRR